MAKADETVVKVQVFISKKYLSQDFDETYRICRCISRLVV